MYFLFEDIKIQIKTINYKMKELFNTIKQTMDATAEAQATF